MAVPEQAKYEDHSELFVTELRKNETNYARRLEFARVARLFHRFVVGHKYGATFTLERVVALQNQELEARFKRRYDEISSRDQLKDDREWSTSAKPLRASLYPCLCVCLCSLSSRDSLGKRACR